MADYYPPYRLVLHDHLPDPVLAELRDVFHQHAGGPLPVVPEHASPGHRVTWTVRGCGAAAGALEALGEDLLRVLLRHRLDVPFTIAEEPWYEILGTLRRYDPGLGFHQVACDAHLDPVVPDTTVAALIAAAGTPAAAVQAIRAELGTAWAVQEGQHVAAA